MADGDLQAFALNGQLWFDASRVTRATLNAGALERAGGGGGQPIRYRRAA